MGVWAGQRRGRSVVGGDGDALGFGLGQDQISGNDADGGVCAGG